jgi:hypothetical protein
MTMKTMCFKECLASSDAVTYGGAEPYSKFRFRKVRVDAKIEKNPRRHHRTFEIRKPADLDTRAARP